MTLQERLREAVKFDEHGCAEIDYDAINEAADALDAQEKRIRELEGALRDAVAAERERCANVCVDLSACVFPHAKDYFYECAAAIRRNK